LKLRRTLLITPANERTLLEKLARSDVDVAWIELEDGIHPAEKDTARIAAGEALSEIDWRGKDRVVRVNTIYGEHGTKDIEHLTPFGPTAFILPKVQEVAEIHAADELITACEDGLDQPPIEIWCMIETARALARVEDLAEASPRVKGLFFGGGDLSADLRVKRVGLGKGRVLPEIGGLKAELLFGRSRVVTAARAVGAQAFDVCFNHLDDLDAIYVDALYSFQLGFDGKMVLSPRHIPVVNRAWAPSDDDLDWAKRVVSSYEEARAGNKTIAVVDGEMVDGPFVRSAELLLERAAAVLETEQSEAQLQQPA
jgi:citrate lyase subunit beta/citryl-CoA lyase